MATKKKVTRKKAKIRRRWTLRYNGWIIGRWVHKPDDLQVEEKIRSWAERNAGSLGRYELCFDGSYRYSWTASLE